MNSKYLFPFFIASLLVFVSCNKEKEVPVPNTIKSIVPNSEPITVPNSGTSTAPNAISHPDTGKWLENKLRIYAMNGTGAKVYDTTFLQPFTSFDYIKFNTNGTCITSLDYYYYPNENGQAIPPQKIPPSASTLNYKAAGSKYVLTIPPGGAIGAGGFNPPNDTVSMVNAHTLLFRSVLVTMQNYTLISESYYGK